MYYDYYSAASRIEQNYKLKMEIIPPDTPNELKKMLLSGIIRQEYIIYKMTELKYKTEALLETNKPETLIEKIVSKFIGKKRKELLHSSKTALLNSCDKLMEAYVAGLSQTAVQLIPAYTSLCIYHTLAQNSKFELIFEQEHAEYVKKLNEAKANNSSR